MKLPSIILASDSPRRAELLRQSGLEFRIVPSDASEIRHDQLTAREISQINAYRKARSVAKRFPDALVLGADTVVSLEAALFGKPATLEQAYEMLEELQGLLCVADRERKIRRDEEQLRVGRIKRSPLGSRGHRFVPSVIGHNLRGGKRRIALTDRGIEPDGLRGKFDPHW